MIRIFGEHKEYSICVKSKANKLSWQYQIWELLKSVLQPERHTVAVNEFEIIPNYAIYCVYNTRLSQRYLFMNSILLRSLLAPSCISTVHQSDTFKPTGPRKDFDAVLFAELQM